MNRKFLILQVVIIASFLVIFIITLNPKIASLIFQIAEFQFNIQIEDISIVPDNMRIYMILMMPFLIMVVFIICWVEERTGIKENYHMEFPNTRP